MPLFAVQDGAAMTDYCHYWLICWIFSRLTVWSLNCQQRNLKMPNTISQSPTQLYVVSWEPNTIHSLWKMINEIKGKQQILTFKKLQPAATLSFTGRRRRSIYLERNHKSPHQVEARWVSKWTWIRSSCRDSVKECLEHTLLWCIHSHVTHRTQSGSRHTHTVHLTAWQKAQFQWLHSSSICHSSSLTLPRIPLQ